MALCPAQCMLGPTYSTVAYASGPDFLALKEVLRLNLSGCGSPDVLDLQISNILRRSCIGLLTKSQPSSKWFHASGPKCTTYCSHSILATVGTFWSAGKECAYLVQWSVTIWILAIHLESGSRDRKSIHTRSSGPLFLIWFNGAAVCCNDLRMIHLPQFFRYFSPSPLIFDK